MDVLFQLINASLLGNEAFDVEDKGLLGKLLKKLNQKQEFVTLLQLMDANKNDTRGMLSSSLMSCRIFLIGLFMKSLLWVRIKKKVVCGYPLPMDGRLRIELYHEENY